MYHPKDCNVLLAEYDRRHPVCHSVEKIHFSGTGKHDVYNITAPFHDGSKLYIAGRVETRKSEDSIVAFFREDEHVWRLDEKLPVLPLQDPFVTRINRRIVVGGVSVYKTGSMTRTWRMAFYSGETLRSLRQFFQGPKGMKDVRMMQLPDRRILLLTRPQLGHAGRGKIGYCVIDRLDKLSDRKLIDAPLFQGQFATHEWGGANELHLLRNGRIGVLGHVAEFDGRGFRHYYAMLFTFDVATGAQTPIEIIATRKDFLPGPAKRLDLKDVVFGGGSVRTGGNLILYAGTSDVEAQKLVMDDPFIKYEA
jgi:Protein of unknown function (DUF1861).